MQRFLIAVSADSAIQKELVPFDCVLCIAHCGWLIGILLIVKWTLRPFPSVVAVIEQSKANSQFLTLLS